MAFHQGPGAGPRRGGAPLEETEHVFVVPALRGHAWSSAKVVKELGVYQGTLQRKMKALGIESTAAGGAER